jgi:hypothetical protein
LFLRRLILVPLLSFSFLAVITVDGSGGADHYLIQNAINASNHADSVLVFPGTYHENINFNGKNITVISYSGEQETIIQPDLNGPAITLNSGEAEVEFSGFTIQNAYNTANGGGIYAYNVSADFKDLIIQNNAAFNMGGGIYINGGIHSFNNCKIYGNDVGDTNGGGMYCIHADSLYINNCEFKYNHSPKNGGGAYINDTYASIKNTQFIENNEGIGGSNPMPSPRGGGVYTSSSEVYFYNNIISSNNSYGGGGGLYGFDSDLEIHNTEICDNISLNYWQGAEGGGICLFNSTMLLNQVTVSGNLANSLQQDNSDGISLNGSSTAEIYNSIIYNNDDAEIRLNDNACLTLDYSDVFGGNSGILGLNSGCCEYGLSNIDLDPLFVDFEGLDFTLQLGSPCINMGIADLDEDGIDDIDDYYGIAPDMGAYEWYSDILGDVNHDQILDILDIVIMINIILSNDYILIADVNSDEAVDILDVIMMVNILVGGLP